MPEIKYEIVEKIGVLSTTEKGWSKELNLVSWNEREPKYDLRDWNENHDKMGKGVTLTQEELDKLTIQIVKNNLPEESTKESTSIALIFVDGKEPMYFIYEPKKELRTISKEELTKLFNDKELESIYNQTEITRKL